MTPELVANLPATIAELAQWLRVPRRDIEKAIQEARLAGVPLVTDADGVRLAKDAAEAADCAARLRSRAISQLLTSRALRKTARRMREAEAQQPTLWAA